MAALTRPVQCSLAVADLAQHIGGPKTVDNLSKESIKDLVQIMGVLSTESAVAQMPKLDKAVALWKAEKKSLRDSITKGVKPDSLKTSLESSSLFSSHSFRRIFSRRWMRNIRNRKRCVSSQLAKEQSTLSRDH